MVAQADKFAFYDGYNDQYHLVMGQLADCKTDDDFAYVPAAILQAMPEGIKQIEAELKADKYTELLTQFSLWASAIPKLLELYPPAQEILTIPKAVWLDLQDPIINWMANLVHDARDLSIKASGKLQGCEVHSFKKDDGPAIYKYCSGVKPGSILVKQVPLQKVTIAGEQWIKQYPSKIIQKLGVHHVEPSFSISGNEIASAIEYHDSYLNHTGSANRLRGVKERLELLGFKCNLGGVENGKYMQYKDIYCNTADIKSNTIRELATFFSIILDADVHLPTANPSAYKVIRDKAWELAIARNNQYGDKTWQSPDFHKPDWSSLYSDWEEEDKFSKNIIYNELRSLSILRDIHHMIEEHYGIDDGKATMEGMKAIVENAKKILSIINQHEEMQITHGGYAWNTIAPGIAHIEALVKAGKPVNIAGPSDAIGHAAHDIIYTMLGKAGQYGGCSTKGHIANINTGNLAYCEGILEGETGTVMGGTAGIWWYHKIVPLTLNVGVDEDEFANYEYAFKINLPAAIQLKQELMAHLKAQGMTCSGNLCQVATKDLDKIRQTAIFLSNLKGVDSTIGDECVKKAIESATKMAVEQNKKGIFAFTQAPIHSSAKEWIDLCFKQHGITPPGMTKEETDLLKLIGAQKVYAGCSFAGSDILPNLGYIKYCEGIRVNPTAKINAFLNTKGTLEHLFHGPPGAPDKIATISITPLEANKYELAISGLDMRDKQAGKPLQNLVVKRLQSTGLTCPDITKCSTAEKPLSEETIRHLAAYLSSMHQAYNVDAYCIPAAEEYAWKKALSLPKDVSAHTVLVYPFEKVEWDKEVCSKLAKPLVKKPTPEVEKKPAPPKAEEAVPAKQFYYYSPAQAIKAIKGKGKNFFIGGCLSKTAKMPTLAIAAFCLGIQQLFEVEGIPKKLTTAGLWPQEGILSIGGAKSSIVFTSMGKALYLTLPPEMMHPLIVDYLDNGLHFIQKGNLFGHTSRSDMFKAAKFLSHLHNFPPLPDDCKEKAVKHAIEQSKIMTYGGLVKPYTPDDWKAFCAPQVVPVAPGQLAFSALPAIEQENIKKWVSAWKAEGKTLAQVLDGFADGWPEVVFGAMTQGIITEFYEQAAPKAVPKPQLTGDPLKSFIISYLTGQSGIPFKEVDFPVIIEQEGGYAVPPAWAINEALGELVKSGMVKYALENGLNTYWIPAEAPTPELDKLIHEAEAKYDSLAAEISKNIELLQKAKAATAYKKLPEKHKDMVHAYMNWKLLEAYKEGKKEEELLKEVEKIILTTYPKLTPLMVKLQLGLEKKAKINKGELPECDVEKCTPKTTKYEEMSEAEQNAIKEFAMVLSEAGEPYFDVIKKTAEHYGLDITDILKEAISSVIPSAIEEEKPEKEEKAVYIPTFATEVPKGLFVATIKTIMDLSTQGLSLPAIISTAYSGWWKSKVKPDVFKKWVESLLQVEIVGEEKPKLNINDLPAHKRGELCKDIYKWYSSGEASTVANLMIKAHDYYNLAFGPPLDKWIDNIVNAFTIKPIPFADLHSFTQEKIEEDAKKLVEEIPDEKITAIKHLRCLHNLSLTDAKYLIEEATAKAMEEAVKKGEAVEAAKLEKPPISMAEMADKVLELLDEAPNHQMDWHEIADVISASYYYPEGLLAATIEQLIKDKAIKHGPGDSYILAEEEEEEFPPPWYFKVISKELGMEEFGPYDTKEDAEQGIANVKKNAALLKDGIHRSYSEPYQKEEEAKEEPEIEKPPAPAEAIQQESMAKFIKQGMSAQAVAILFADAKPEKLEKTAKKLYKLYHPDEEVMTMPLTSQPSWVQNKVKNLAQSMLQKGKTQEDTAWWISYHMHLTKESVQHMVNTLAKIPISKTEELLQAFKILGVGEELGGCTVATHGLAKLKGQTVSYCQGVIAPMGTKPIAEIGIEGEKVHHKTDHQDIHVLTDIEDKSWITELSWWRDLTGENPAKQIARVLHDWGFTCNEEKTLHPHLACKYRGTDGHTMSIEDQDSLRKTAIFLSGIDSIPLLPEKCIPKAIEYAKNHSIGISKTSKPWSVNVYPNTVEEWQKTVCEKAG